MIPLIARIPRPIRFVAIGSWNTLFSYVVYVGLYRFLRAAGAGEDLAGLVGIVLSNAVAIPQAFFAYKFLVFETRGNYRVEFGRFLVSNVVVPLLNLGLFPLTIRYLPMGPLVDLGRCMAGPAGLAHLVDRATVAQALLQLFLALASYLLHRHYSFRPRST